MTESSPADLSIFSDFNTVPQVAEFLNVSSRTLYDLVAAGRIAHVRLSERVIRLRKEQVLSYVETCTHEPAPAEIPDPPRMRRSA